MATNETIVSAGIMRTLTKMFKLATLPVLKLTGYVNLSLDGLELMKQQVVAPVQLNLHVAGYVVTHTVPLGERWYVSDFYVGATNVAKADMCISVAGKLYSIGIAGTGSQLIDLLPFFLEAGDFIEVYGTNDAADTNISCNLVYQRVKMEGS